MLRAKRTCGEVAAEIQHGLEDGTIFLPSDSGLDRASCATSAKEIEYPVSTVPNLEAAGSIISLPWWKRVVDLIGCLAVIPLLATLTLFWTLISKWSSPGPVLFRQERVGFRGRRFKIYKFRTLHVNVDTCSHANYFRDLVGTNAPMIKLDSQGDSRLMPGAWFLRASGLDELPQIINVLQGDMSLVGPRPCLPPEVEIYSPWQMKRFEAVPGLTGLWQVSGKNHTTFDEMIRLDIRYATNISLLQDMRIMLMTVPAIVVQVIDMRMGRLDMEASVDEFVPSSSSRSAHHEA